MPYVIREIYEGGSALAALNGIETEIRIDLIENPTPGDTVLVHAGFAIQKLDERESAELAALWKEMHEAERAGSIRA
jgi:hydrogenase expression/formation protein HypC